MAPQSATPKEMAEAMKRAQDGSKPVTIEKRKYKNKVTSGYIEEEVIPDLNQNLDTLFKDFGHVL